MAAMGMDRRVAVAAERGEALAARADHRERWSVVTARAIGSLAEAAETGMPLVAIGGALIAWKRRPIDAELADATGLLRALGGRSPRIVDAGLVGRPNNILVVVDKIERTPDLYPRDPAMRRRRHTRQDRGLR